VRQGEGDIVIVHLLSQRSLGISSLDALYLHDLNAMSSSPVSGGHVTVALCHCPCSAHIAVFSVHVVGAGTRIVSDPDSEVLDFCGGCVAALKERRR
jgi:hypothetical protein